MNDLPLEADEYQCAVCQGVFKKGWSDEEAKTEAKANWGDIVDVASEPMEVVCDDCHKKLMRYYGMGDNKP